ncbi:hypothetical protein BN381_80079 [Candidatus Microthrix parvicella RN1]|uniref:Uncharacterized protein n=1 Tax=Candidatus Neomicrothrix parvicella RN1 TaxID=1229780 RepID=R4Z3N0_9ACTN|nr:hypothetical protein BN381_80079 [Candidatus Microthrix parvicella RN1]
MWMGSTGNQRMQSTRILRDKRDPRPPGSRVTWGLSGVRPPGLEPGTYGLRVRRSNQLS